MTEVGVNCFAMTSEEAMCKRGSIGRPMMFCEARLVDGEDRVVPAGEVGCMHLRGPHVCQGYWDDPGATAAALGADGWFRTGDLARRDDEGFYYIVGREKDMYISGGVNVYPAEIEGALLEHAAVRDAAVVGLPDEKWGEVGVAFVVPEAAVGRTAAADLAGFLETRLARYKLPAHIVAVDDLPRTPYGKVQKHVLRSRYLSP